MALYVLNHKYVICPWFALSIKVCYLIVGMENVRMADITQVGVYNLENLICRWEFYHVGLTSLEFLDC